MLSSLSIRDLAVVDRLDLEFGPGFTVLTGETGAGKSILLTALGLALGDRGDASLIRPGAQRAEIQLGFTLAPGDDASAWLVEREMDDEETCSLRRVLSADGRSKAFVNSRPVTLQTLQELGGILVEIHGQHAHLGLLQSAEQRRLVDQSSPDPGLAVQVQELFERWRELNRELTACRTGIADRVAREELLRYQLEEMARLEIAELNYQELANQHTRLANVERIGSLAQEQIDLLYDNEQVSIARLLVQAQHAARDLEALAPEVSGLLETLESAAIQIKDAASTLRHTLDSLEYDPHRLQELDERLAEIHRLARKHQVAPPDLPAKCEELKSELASLLHGTERADELAASVAQTEHDYAERAARLSEQRQQTAARLGQRISELIRELGMPHGLFEIEVQPQPEVAPNAHGRDRIEFRVAANPGLPPRPITKVASGGELSRLSLAIQVSAIDYKNAPSLIFDEVDSGIGGRVAEIVGQKLRFLATHRQVFCVTHLPQVAAQGQHHLLVEKSTRGQVTQTSVRGLCADERKAEIARMLGGIRITAQTLAHAEEMLGWASPEFNHCSPCAAPSKPLSND
jgi:DNA repair protein RecN (Recombination protein N)